MAKFELKFIDACDSDDFIKCEREEYLNSEEKNVDGVFIRGTQEGSDFLIILDKSTAIKFAKTLRTEINKITERENPVLQKGSFTTLTGSPKKGGQNG